MNRYNDKRSEYCNSSAGTRDLFRHSEGQRERMLMASRSRHCVSNVSQYVSQTETDATQTNIRVIKTSAKVNTQMSSGQFSRELYRYIPGSD